MFLRSSLGGSNAQPKLKSIELNHKLVSAAVFLEDMPLNLEYFGSEDLKDLGKDNHHPPHTHTKMSLPGRSQRLELEFWQLSIFGNVASSSEGSREGLWYPQLPQTFPDHKNDPCRSPWSPRQSCGGSGGAPCQVLPSF